jgi:pimeloyl-ACP methyl ester carboxylesterase
VTSTFTPSHRGGSGSPLVCLHGFTDTWRTWELVLPALEAEHDVLAPTLLAHAGGPVLQGEVSDVAIVDAVEEAMDAAGFATAHLVGNSLGGYIALQLAARGRAESVVALAPAGGWAKDDTSSEQMLDNFVSVYEQLQPMAAQAEMIASTPEGRRMATALVATNYEHIPADLIAHQIVGVTRCEVMPLVAYGREAGFDLDAEKVECPVRFVWGTNDLILPWPSYAARFKAGLPTAEWIELDGIGHMPQIDVTTETAQLILGHAA